MFLQILKSPRYLVGLFTQEKSFSANPLIGSRLLNRLGLHVLRLVMAHGLTQLRWWMLRGLLPSAERERYHRDGYLIIEDFLPAEAFEGLQTEIRGYRGEAWQMTQGDTLTQHILMDRTSLAELPATRRVIESKRYRHLLGYTGATLALPRVLIQRIANGYASGQPDPQKTLHSDTFHPTMKAWLFLDDVGREKGAFTYAAGSHKLTWARIKWEYRQSLLARESSNSHVRAGAFRFYQDDLKALGVAGGQQVAVKKNTLVLANTFGLHCRGPAEGRIQRLELWAYSRKNPFLLWPGFGARWYAEVEARIARKVIADREKSAEAEGRKAQWQTVDVDLSDA